MLGPISIAAIVIVSRPADLAEPGKVQCRGSWAEVQLCYVLSPTEKMKRSCPSGGRVGAQEGEKVALASSERAGAVAGWTLRCCAFSTSASLGGPACRPTNTFLGGSGERDEKKE